MFYLTQHPMSGCSPHCPLGEKRQPPHENPCLHGRQQRSQVALGLEDKVRALGRTKH